jgi:hypothetical protein
MEAIYQTLNPILYILESNVYVPKGKSTLPSRYDEAVSQGIFRVLPIPNRISGHILYVYMAYAVWTG